MKKVTFIIILILTSVSIFAQSPGGINYQTILRDGDGEILISTQVSIQFGVLADSPDGTSVYVERHNAVSNAFGLVNLIIGSGEVVSGNFHDIDWGITDYFLETAVEYGQNKGYQVIGTTQFLSVPLAFHATALTLTNPAGNQYKIVIDDQGNLVAEIILTFPVVTTDPVSGITANSATMGGNVTDGGNTPVTDRGVFYGTAPDPENTGTKLQIGSGTGAFSSTLGNLASGTPYYVKAYATNSKGTVYGDEVSFTTPVPFVCGVSTVTDVDGNVYNTTLIGSQCWLTSNLKVTRYNNNDPIPTGYNNSVWAALTSGAYSVYPFTGLTGITSEAQMIAAYGLLYNGFTIQDNRGLCPSGWRLPTYPETQTLEQATFSTTPANVLRSCRAVGSPLGGACNTNVHPRWDQYAANLPTDDFGFGLLPSGERKAADGSYSGIGWQNYIWTSSPPINPANTNALASRLAMIWYNSWLQGDQSRQTGQAVRCVKQ